MTNCGSGSERVGNNTTATRVTAAIDALSPVDLPPSRDEDGFRNRGRDVTRLEAFVDAAFAFAVTLIVISVNDIPRTSAELLLAFKSLPMFAASFLLVTVFWRGHADWSRRYGLDDAASRNRSLFLIFLILVFVYPLRMVFATFFSWISGGWLIANLSFTSVDDIRLMFAVFAAGFGSMGATMAALYLHAWRRRNVLGLDAVEQMVTRYAMLRWSLLPLFSLLSLALVAWLPEVPGVQWRVGLPGLIFFALSPIQWVLRRRQRRDVAQLAAIAS